jgi:hypothetical protein
MAFAISPNFQDTDFPGNPSLEQKIDIFEDRVKGWQISIAQQCADNIDHSGFAVLSIVFSYFEMIAKIYDGYLGNYRSKEYFKRGFELVFPLVNTQNSQLKDKFLEKLYADVRCGLYHAGKTGYKIELSGDFTMPIAFVISSEKIQINPHLLVPVIQSHFESYILQLREKTNLQLLQNFEKRFGH